MRDTKKRFAVHVCRHTYAHMHTRRVLRYLGTGRHAPRTESNILWVIIRGTPKRASHFWKFSYLGLGKALGF